jgi:hypothetical protein
MMSKAAGVFAALLLGGQSAEGFYLPGVNPQSFGDGDV